MRVPRNLAAWAVGVALVAVLLWIGESVRQRDKLPGKPAIPDLGVTSPLNQPGGAAAPAEAYAVYSALYETPAGEPLAFASASMTDIPQVNGSCLQPRTAQERDMMDAFVDANRQSHRWENRFTIAAGYQLLSSDEAARALDCLPAGGKGRDCASYAQLRHVRYLGVPGFDRTHTRALVSVVKRCGPGECGSGGVFEVEKVNGHWQRAETTDFTRECNWMY